MRSHSASAVSALLAAMLFLCTGCQLFHRAGSIKVGDAMVQGPKDPGTPSTVNTSNAGTSIPLPAGSTIEVTKTAAAPAAPATKDSPAVAAQPAKEVTKITAAGPTEYRKTEAAIQAATGTVDTSIRQHQIDAAESRPLLYAAIAAAFASGFFIWRAYPTPALACGAAAVVFFMAWKVSGLPDWFWAVGLLAGGVGCALYLGHEKGELHAKSTLTGQQPPTTG